MGPLLLFILGIVLSLKELSNIMRIYLYTLLLFVCIQPIQAQKKIISKINLEVTAAELEAHLSFLASDEMRGRDTGSPEIDIAANYIATQFKLAGIKPGSGASYFQDVQLERINPPISSGNCYRFRRSKA